MAGKKKAKAKKKNLEGKESPDLDGEMDPKEAASLLAIQVGSLKQKLGMVALTRSFGAITDRQGQGL